MVTQANVNDDIRMVSENLSEGNRALVRPIDALKTAFSFPTTIIAGYLIALAYSKAVYTPHVDGFGDIVPFSTFMSAEIATTCFGVLFALILGFSLYGPALAYLSVPEKIRRDSLVISSLRNTGKKTVMLLILINWCVALMGVLVNSIFLCAAPAMLLLSVFITQWVINSEATRYGFASVLEKLNSMLKKM